MWEILIGLLLQERHGLADSAAGERRPLEGRGIELLEGRETVGLHRLVEPDEGRQGHHVARRGAQLIIEQPRGRAAERARHLGDHFIGPALDIDAVDIVAA